MLGRIFSFPNPVNEYAARFVAGMVVMLALAILLTGQAWLMFFLAYGFLARVAMGPRISPMGLLATRVITPRLGLDKPTAGAPKRFAQAVGAVFSVSAIVLHFVLGAPLAANVVLAILVVFASLEAFLGFCAGCYVFYHLMRWGLIPQRACRECYVRYEPTTIGS